MKTMEARKEALIDAPPEAVFEIVSDVSRHPELAGSGEVQQVRVLSPGPIGVGTRFEADEDIRLGPGMRNQLVASSEVLECDPPRTFSWRSSPAGRQQTNIQWWFRLEPEAGRTRLVNEVRADTGLAMGVLTKGLFLMTGRERAIRRGMERTLENIKRVAEQQPNA